MAARSGPSRLWHTDCWPAGADGKINLWPKDRAAEPVVLGLDSRVSSLAILRNGQLASGTYDGKINLWQKGDIREPAALVQAHQGSPVDSLAVLADGRLASGHYTVEADIGRFKRVIGDALRSRTERCRATEVAIAVHVRQSHGEARQL